MYRLQKKKKFLYVSLYNNNNTYIHTYIKKNTTFIWPQIDLRAVDGIYEKVMENYMQWCRFLGQELSLR